MALSSTGVLEVRPGGSDSNAGYFNPSGGSPGTDYSQQDTAQVTIDGATVAAAVHTTTTQINITGSTVSAAWNRNGLRITGGTATAGLYEITAVDVPNNRITVDRSAGTSGQTATGTMGGGLATPGQAGGLKTVAGMCVAIKYGTYTLSTTSTNVSGGPVVDTTGGASGSVFTAWYGYDTTRTPFNTDANRPTILVPASGVSSINAVYMNSSATWVCNLIVDGAAKTGIVGFVTGSGAGGSAMKFYRCRATRCTGGGFANSRDSGSFIACEADNCTTVAAFTNTGGNTDFSYCYAHDNTVTGFSISSGVLLFCVSESNTGAGFTYPAGTAGAGLAVGCVAYNNTSTGFAAGNSNWRTPHFNCIAANNGAFGFSAGASNAVQPLVKCATYSNTSGAYANYSTGAVQGHVTLTADPFTNAAAGDFSLNNTAGGGAACRAAGFPGTFPGGTTTGYADIGAAQHQDSGGAAAGARLVGPSALITPWSAA